MTFDTFEDEMLFTRAALAADPDSADLVSATESWLGLIDAARAKDRDARAAIANTDAARVVANGRLDRACGAFGDDLHRAVEKDRAATRWTQFFSVPVSRFVRQALSRQSVTVRAWLMSSMDAVLEQHRDALERWTAAAEKALVQTRGTALVRGGARQAREELAEELTRERDGLHDALRSRGRERGLPRDWSDVFFRVESRSGAAAVDEPAEPAPA
jgi:hypothetical protein